MNTDHKETWPVCYRTQREAQIPEGDFHEEVRPKHWVYLSLLFVLLVVGPAVPDLIDWLI